jgi:hypothetical protein
MEGPFKKKLLSYRDMIRVSKSDWLRQRQNIACLFSRPKKQTPLKS